MKKFLLIFAVALFIPAAGFCASAPERVNKDGGVSADSNAIFEKEPETLEALLNRARELKSMGRYEEAASAYERASELAPPAQRDAIKVELATVLGFSKRYEDSIRTFNEVIKANPGNMDARKGLARSYGWAGMYDKAVAEYRSVLAERPADTEAQIGLSRVYSWQGRLDDAIAGYRAVLDTEPGNVEARIGLANALWWQGEAGKSMEEVDTLLTRDPGNAEAIRLRRRLREDMGPLFTLSWASSSDTDSNRLVIYRALAYLNLGPLTRINLDYSQYWPKRFNEKGRADIFTVKDTLRVAKGLSISPRLSFVKVKTGLDGTSYIAGGVSASWDFMKGSRAQLSYSYSPMVDNTELLRNNVKLKEYSAFVSHDYREVTVSASAAGGDYSDGNSRKGVSGSIAWKVTRDPALIAGYIIEYRDFARKTQSGYFNPDSILSNNIYLTLRGGLLNERLDYSATATAGIQSFESRTDYISSFQAGITGRLSRNLSVDAGYKWSRSALESASGFRFEQYSAALNYLF